MSKVVTCEFTDLLNYLNNSKRHCPIKTITISRFLLSPSYCVPRTGNIDRKDTL